MPWTLAIGVIASLLLQAATCDAADALKTVRARGTLIWGADAEGGGPFVYPREDDPTKVQGFEVELADLLAAKLGVEAQFSQGHWEQLPELLERGDIDIVLNGYEWTPAWSRRFGSTIPYYTYELQMLVRAGDMRYNRLEDLRQQADESGRKTRVAVLGGSAAENYMRDEFGDSIELILYEGNTDAMWAVERNIDKIDATLQDLPIVSFYEDRFAKLRRLDSPVAPGHYVIFTRKHDTELVKALNAAILECWQDGSLPAVYARYGMWNDTQRQRGLLVDDRGNFLQDPSAQVAGENFVPLQSDSEDHSVWRRIPLLLRGAGVTVLLSVIAMPLAILVGLLIAVLRMYGPALIALPLRWYIEIVRGTPLVLQLYVIFFLLPELGLSVPAMWAAVIALAMNYSAYEAENYRAGLQAIPRGQMEAALSLGMTRVQSLRRIIVPQAMRLVIPPVTNDFISLFKDTAVCSVITVVELSKEYSIHARSTGAVVELAAVTAFLYLAMSYPLSVFAGRMERRLAKGRARD